MRHLEVPRHPLGIDDQPVDQGGRAVEGEVEEDAAVGKDHPLDRAVRDVPLVPEGHVLQGRDHRRPDEAGEAREILGQHGVALVGHGRAALLARREEFLGLSDLRPLQMPDLRREPLDGAGDDAQGRHEQGVAVARDDLRRDRLRDQPEPPGHGLLDPGVDVGEGADGARDRAGGDLLPGPRHALPIAGELGEEAGELEAERRGLGVDAVAPAHRRRELVLEGAAPEGLEEAIEIGQEQVARPRELDGEAGVQQIGGGHAQVQVAGLDPADLLHMGEERDHIVAGDGLDGLDPGRVDQPLPLAGDPLGQPGDLGPGQPAQLGHRPGGGQLDLEPDPEPRLDREDQSHLGAAVAGDHGRSTVAAGDLLVAIRFRWRERRL